MHLQSVFRYYYYYYYYIVNISYMFRPPLSIHQKEDQVQGMYKTLVCIMTRNCSSCMYKT
jgi:hypothetical protein